MRNSCWRFRYKSYITLASHELCYCKTDLLYQYAISKSVLDNSYSIEQVTTRALRYSMLIWHVQILSKKKHYKVCKKKTDQCKICKKNIEILSNDLKRSYSIL